MFACRQALARPTSEMPNLFDRVRVGSDQTSLSERLSRKRMNLPATGREIDDSRGYCSRASAEAAGKRDAKSVTFLPCLPSALCRSLV